MSNIANVCPLIFGNPICHIRSTYGRRKKNLPICRFRSRLISVRLPFLSVFKPFMFCPKGSSSVLVNGPDNVIKHAQSLIVQEASR